MHKTVFPCCSSFVSRARLSRSLGTRGGFKLRRRHPSALQCTIGPVVNELVRWVAHPAGTRRRPAHPWSVSPCLCVCVPRPTFLPPSHALSIAQVCVYVYVVLHRRGGLSGNTPRAVCVTYARSQPVRLGHSAYQGVGSDMPRELRESCRPPDLKMKPLCVLYILGVQVRPDKADRSSNMSLTDSLACSLMEMSNIRRRRGSNNDLDVILRPRWRSGHSWAMV